MQNGDNMFTLDSDILIKFLNSDEIETSFIFNLLKSGDTIYVSTVSETEILSFKNLNAQEIGDINEFLKSFSLVVVDSNIAKIGGAIRRKYGLKTPDALIAATAIFTGSTLVTRNLKDFKKVKELKLLDR